MWASFLPLIGFSLCEYGIKMNLQKLEARLTLFLFYILSQLNFCQVKIVLILHNNTMAALHYLLWSAVVNKNAQMPSFPFRH